MSVIVKGRNPRRGFTVRYWVAGRAREKSFYTLSEAKDFKIKVDHDLRARIFTEDSRDPFGPAAEAYIVRLTIAPRSRVTYTELYARHLAPALADRTLAAVARDREAVTLLLTSGALGSLSASKRRAARKIVIGTLNEAILAGKIASHRCDGIELADHGIRNDHDGFVFPAHAQVEQVGRRCGLWVWVARGCGLRIQEALAVERGDFREGGAVLRVARQASRDGKVSVPLKSRKPGEFRDIPCPQWLWAMVRDLPDGPLCPGWDGRRYMTYRNQQRKFHWEAGRAGIPDGFTPHSLRHAFASALLARGVPITDVAAWLGHRNINTTYATYGHLVPSAAARAVTALDAEYLAWFSGGTGPDADG